MINEVRNNVRTLLAQVDKAHGIDHIDRVYDLSMNFAKAMDIKDTIEIELIALLHDVDDYKLFGKQNTDEDLPNAYAILRDMNLDDGFIETILKCISEIGFNKRLKGVQPTSVAAMIVSDADMCDGMGVTGIARTTLYSAAKNRPFFDVNIIPRINITYDEYMNQPSKTAINHIFEKLLRLRSMMLTTAGYQESLTRHTAMVNYLKAYFKENNLTDWDNLLADYLIKLEK